MIQLKVNKFKITAPPITNAKVGSHPSFIVKNPIIFDFLHIPEKIKPNPKMSPKIKLANYSQFPFAI